MLIQYLTVAGLSALKFVPGAALAIGLQFNFFEQVLVTGIGGIAGTTLFTYFGDAIRQFFRRLRKRQRAAAPPKKPEHEQPSLARKIWDRFGLVGCALLTPPFFSPPIGTAIAVSFGEKKEKIVLYMAVSMVLWAFLFAFLGSAILDVLEEIGLFSTDTTQQVQ